jgi:hypothetical protein
VVYERGSGQSREALVVCRAKRSGSGAVRKDCLFQYGAFANSVCEQALMWVAALATIRSMYRRASVHGGQLPKPEAKSGVW